MMIRNSLHQNRLFSVRGVFLGICFLSLPLFLWAGESGQKLLEKGISLANQGELEEALVFLRQATDKNKNSSEAHIALGLVALEANNHSEAEKALRTAVSIDSHSARAYYGLGMLYEKLKRKDEAIHSWEKLKEVAKSDDLKEMAIKHIGYLKGSSN